MKHLLFLLIVLAPCQLHFGAEFKNLGFDDGDIAAEPGIPSNVRLTTKALPGWTVYSDSTPQEVLYANESFDPSVEYVTIADYQHSSGVAEDSSGFQGGLTIILQRTKPESLSWRLEQTGTVPPDARFLTYRNWQCEMQVRVDGQVIRPLNPQPSTLAATPTNLVYDISQFAGREIKLELIGPTTPSFWPALGCASYIDSIAFLPQEPKFRGIATAQYGGTNYTALTFYPRPGVNQIVELCDALFIGNWQALPGAPRNSGSVTDTNTTAQRFYRLRLANP
jgi:hypothetical protein